MVQVSQKEPKESDQLIQQSHFYFDFEERVEEGFFVLPM